METIFTGGKIITKLIETMREKRMTAERLNILADVLDPNADLGDRDAVRAALKLDVLAPSIFHLTVNYDMPLEAMIIAGRYDRRDRDINEMYFHTNWTSKGIVRFEARYFNFNLTVLLEYVAKMIVSADTVYPWRSAGVEHLLSLGITFPEEQRRFKIAALGSPAKVAFSGTYVPYLGQVDLKRNLGLYRLKDPWPPVYRFLAVRELTRVSLAA